MKYESYEQFLSTIPEENRKLYDESSLQLLFKFEQSDSELDKVRKQLSEAIEVIKFYGDTGNWYDDEMACTDYIKVVGTAGLQGSNRIVLGPAKQIVVGTDLYLLS